MKIHQTCQPFYLLYKMLVRVVLYSVYAMSSTQMTRITRCTTRDCMQLVKEKSDPFMTTFTLSNIWMSHWKWGS